MARGQAEDQLHDTRRSADKVKAVEAEGAGRLYRCRVSDSTKDAAAESSEPKGYADSPVRWWQRQHTERNIMELSVPG